MRGDIRGRIVSLGDNGIPSVRSPESNSGPDVLVHHSNYPMTPRQND
jgi:hypothetical protein